jgi:hypothetical protein
MSAAEYAHSGPVRAARHSADTARRAVPGASARAKACVCTFLGVPTPPRVKCCDPQRVRGPPRRRRPATSGRYRPYPLDHRVRRRALASSTRVRRPLLRQPPLTPRRWRTAAQMLRELHAAQARGGGRLAFDSRRAHRRPAGVRSDLRVASQARGDRWPHRGTHAYWPGLVPVTSSPVSGSPAARSFTRRPAGAYLWDVRSPSRRRALPPCSEAGHLLSGPCGDRGMRPCNSQRSSYQRSQRHGHRQPSPPSGTCTAQRPELTARDADTGETDGGSRTRRDGRSHGPSRVPLIARNGG